MLTKLIKVILLYGITLFASVMGVSYTVDEYNLKFNKQTIMYISFSASFLLSFFLMSCSGNKKENFEDLGPVEVEVNVEPLFDEGDEVEEDEEDEDIEETEEELEANIKNNLQEILQRVTAEEVDTQDSLHSDTTNSLQSVRANTDNSEARQMLTDSKSILEENEKINAIQNKYTITPKNTWMSVPSAKDVRGSSCMCPSAQSWVGNYLEY